MCAGRLLHLLYRPMRRRPTVHRGTAACVDEERLPHAEHAFHPANIQFVEGAEAGQSRSRGGGGGISHSRPRRKDPEQLVHAGLEPAQEELLARAHSIYLSPTKRRAACSLQHGSQDRVAREMSQRECPLSPVKSRPCSTDECHCKLSHYVLSLNIPLDSPSQVRSCSS